MTRNAGHIAASVSELITIVWNTAPRRVVFSNCLRVLRTLVEVTSAGCDSVERLWNTPPTPRHNHRVLNNVASLQVDVSSLFAFSFSIACDALKQRNPCARFVAHSNARQVLTNQRLILCLTAFCCCARHCGGGESRSK